MIKPLSQNRSDTSRRLSIAIVGASGLIGQALYRRLKPLYPVLGTYCSNEMDGLVPLDLCRRDYSILDASDVVILAAGETNIDRCKIHQQQAYAVNVEGMIALAKYLADREIRMLFLSSDQVFDGGRGNYLEDDIPNPINEYGRMKWHVEQRCREMQPSSLVLRLSKTYSTNLMEGGMMAEVIHTLRQGKSYPAAYNQIFNPTDVDWLSRQIEKAIRMNMIGLYHLADPRIESRYAFACRIALEYGLNPERVQKIDLADICFAEARAMNSSLNVSRILGVLNESVA